MDYKEITTASTTDSISDDDYIFVNQYDSLKQIKKSDWLPEEIINQMATKELIQSIISKKPAIETLADFFSLQASSDVYQTKIWKSSYNPTSTCEKLGANAGLVCSPSTNSVEGQDDYADKPEFMWWYCNYKYDTNGNKIVTAIEGDDNYSETGTVDVGVVGMTFYYNFDYSNKDYDLLSWSTRPNESLGLIAFDYCQMHDGTVRPYYVLSAFPSVLGTDGLLHSQPYKKVQRNQSYNNMIENYKKKGAKVTGARASRNTFQIIFNLLKYGTKNSQSIYKGVTNYSFQFNAAVERTETDTYFPITTSQANSIEVGCYVSVGYAIKNTDGTLNKDRGINEVHAYADDVKVLRIEDMSDGNKAIYLDVETGFTTAPFKLTDSLSSPIIMTSMHMYTGDSKNVIGKHDGSNISNTSGRHSYRVQGVEYALGSYIVASDTVMIFNADYSKNVYVAPLGVAHSTSDSVIKSTYKLAGTIPTSANGNNDDFWIGDVIIDVKTGAWFPSSTCSSDAQGYGDRCYAGGKNSGSREFLMGGSLGDGSVSGSACLACWGSFATAGWSCCGCD